MVDVQLRGGVGVLRLVYFCRNYGKLSRDNRGVGRLNRNGVVVVVVSAVVPELLADGDFARRTRVARPVSGLDALKIGTFA